MRLKISISFLILILTTVNLGAMEAKIVQTAGIVKYRQGMEETWHTAYAGIILKEIDTIQTGEGGEVILEIHDGLTFRLGANAILDIAELRKISEQDLFLYLTRQKIERIEQNGDKPRLQISNVSAIHGTSQDTLTKKAPPPALNLWEQEKNGAKALFDQQYFPNTVLKLHKILSRYPDVDDCGELHCYLGQSFEALDQPGQALDAYQTVIEESEESNCDHPEWEKIAREGMERLKQ
jgi:hypothetical protein